MKSMTKINTWDMHCHTIFSDGTHTPTQLIHEAKEQGLAGVALTDHDTWSGWKEAEVAAHAEQFPLIRGSEITAKQQNNDKKPTSVHLLAWLYNPQGKKLNDLFQRTRQNRLNRAITIVNKLSHYYPIDWESVTNEIKEGDSTTVGRPHIADALIKAGIYHTRTEAFKGALSKDGPFYIPVHSPTVEEVIEAIKDAQGVVAIAHGGSLERNTRLLTDTDIQRYAECGLDGLEVWHRENSMEQQERLLQLTKHLHLLATGGSDWHGPSGKLNQLGENTTSEDVVQEIIERGYLPVIQ